MLHQEKPVGAWTKDEDYRLKKKKHKKRGEIKFVILLPKRLDNDRQGKDMDEGKMEGDKTDDEQGGVRRCKAEGGAGTQ